MYVSTCVLVCVLKDVQFQASVPMVPIVRFSTIHLEQSCG